MKQHITVQEYNDFFEDLGGTKEDLEFLYTKLGGTACDINIGKMIEKLNFKYGFLEIAKESNEADGTVFWVCVGNLEYYDFELCDALWKAIKYELKED